MLPGVARGDASDTELGMLRPGRARATGAVHVAVRPEQLELRAGRQPPTPRSSSASSAGHDVLYRLRHEGGRTLLVQLPSLELYEVGARVFVRPADRPRVAPVVD